MVNLTFVRAVARRGMAPAVNTAIVAPACSFITFTAVPHVAADNDEAPRRGEWQTHARPAALIPRPSAASERNVS